MQFLKDLWAKPATKAAATAVIGAVLYALLQAIGLDPAQILKK